MISGAGIGLVTAVAYGAQPARTAVVSLALWTLTTGSMASPKHTAIKLQPGQPARVALVIFTIVAALAATEALSAMALRATFLTLAAAAGTAVVLSAVRVFSRRPVRALVVGDPEAVDVQVKLLEDHSGFEVVGQRTAGEGADDAELHGGSLVALVRTASVETVVVALGPAFTAQDLQQLCWDLEHTDTTILVGGVVDRVAPYRVRAGTCAGMPVVALAPSRRSRLTSVVKSALDRSVAAVLLLLLSPVLGLLALAVRIDSPGPAMFKQRRVGIGAEPFVMYKLRTMYVDDVPIPRQLRRTAGNEVLFKMRDDPRVTRVGRFLRRSSLDELPQLLNVVRGEMSLIGPRPALFEETTKYDRMAWRRTAVKPGITGLWQVSGRSDLSWEKSLALDLHYVDNWRLLDDLAIAARTFWAVVRQRGAY